MISEPLPVGKKGAYYNDEVKAIPIVAEVPPWPELLSDELQNQLRQENILDNRVRDLQDVEVLFRKFFICIDTYSYAGQHNDSCDKPRENHAFCHVLTKVRELPVCFNHAAVSIMTYELLILYVFDILPLECYLNQVAVVSKIFYRGIACFPSMPLSLFLPGGCVVLGSP